MSFASLSTSSNRIDGRLEAPRHARRRLARRQPEHPAAERADRDREDDRVEIDDREIDQAFRLAGRQMGQVVDDVLTGGERVAFGCHVDVLFRVGHWSSAHATAAPSHRSACTTPARSATPANSNPAPPSAPPPAAAPKRHLHHRPDQDAERARCRRHARQRTRRAARHQQRGNHHHSSAVQRRHRQRTTPVNSQASAAITTTENSLRRDHAPRGNGRLAGCQFWATSARLRLPHRRLLLVVETVSAACTAPIAADHRGGGGTRHGDSAPPKSIRVNPPATIASSGHCREARSGGRSRGPCDARMPSSPPNRRCRMLSFSLVRQPRLHRRCARDASP